MNLISYIGSNHVANVTPRSQKWETPPKTVTPVSITANFSDLRRVLPKAGMRVYRVWMPRTDENGRQLKALLDYLLDGEIDAKDIYDALGTSSSTYYRRIKEHDYPNAEELRRVADRFSLSYPDLQIQFGLMSRQEVLSYVESAPFTTMTAVQEAVQTKQSTRPPKLSELKPRADAPPL
jgi:hypothetical protein